MHRKGSRSQKLTMISRMPFNMKIYLACLFLSWSNLRVSSQGRGCRGLTDDWEDGDVVTFNCGSDYKLVGAKKATCRDGEWDPPRPTCKRICFRPISLDLDLIIRPSQLTYLDGNTVTYSCNEGHSLYGTETATCTDSGFFDPPTVPTCEALGRRDKGVLFNLAGKNGPNEVENHCNREHLQCHTKKQTVCEPGGSDCNTYAPPSANEQRTVQYCEENTKLCFIYQFGVKGDSVTVNTTTSGCVTNEELDPSYGCYDRSYLEKVDLSGANKLKRLEEGLNTQADDVQVCFCNRDICNESVETAARNDATTTSIMMKLTLGSMMGYLSLWT